MANFLKRALRGLLPNLENPTVPLSLGLASMGWGMPTDSNENVSEMSALQVPTILGCVRILSEGVGSLPLRVYEELERGRKTAKSHPLYRLLTLEPNPNTTAVNLLSTLMVHAALWQNAYCEIERNAAGQPIGLYPRVPWLTKPKRQSGVLVFETTDTSNHSPRIIKAADMIQVVGFSVDAQLGLSLIAQARQSVGLALAAARFGAKFYSNGAKPGGVIECENSLSPEDQKRLKEDIERMSSGGNAYRLVVLSPGMKYNVVASKQDEAQYIETRKFEREEIAAIFRVPGYMVGATDKALKSTIEAQNLEFLTYSLRPWIERFEQEFNRKLLPPVGRNANKFSIHFFTDALLSVDAKTRTERYHNGIQDGWLSPADAREAEGLPFVEGTDRFLTPLNMQAVGTASGDIETDDEPAGDVDSTDEQDNNTVTRAKALYSPLLKDAFSRLSHRSKHDSAAIQQALEPICRSFAAYLRPDSEAGTNEERAISKYMDGVEARSKSGKLTAEDEFRRLSKSLVYAIESDKAETRAKEVLADEQ